MDQSGGGRKTRNPAPINARPAFPTSRRGLLRAGAAALGLVLPGAGLAQSVDVRGRGYDPLWRDAEDAIAAFLGPGPYLRSEVDRIAKAATQPSRIRGSAAE